MVSFGAGDGSKDIALLKGLLRAGLQLKYFPVDASQPLLELACAAGLVRRSRWAAAASVAVLAGVFPANVQMALDAGTGRNPGLADNRALAWARLPLQPVLMWAALQARPDER